jgi:hypothetical protein
LSGGGFGVDFVFFTVAPFVGNGDLNGDFTQPVQKYVDAGQTPTVDFTTPISEFTYVIVNLVGYEMNCNVAPCANFAGDKVSAPLHSKTAH